MPSTGSLDHIAIYPVKGMRGLSLAESHVQPIGLAHDRRFLAIRPTGEFLSQRELARMATISSLFVDGAIKLWTDKPEEICVDLDGLSIRKQVTIWKNSVDALDCGDAVATWLTEKLDEPCRLVYMDDRALRRVDANYGREGDLVSFADGFPVLLTSASSLFDLNSRMDDPVLMKRFRPNLVVDGFEPWAEDHWRRIRVGDVEFRVVKACARCIVTTTDQETGRRLGNEPLKTLATFRQWDGKVFFGMNLIPNGTGTVRVGDPVEVLA